MSCPARGRPGAAQAAIGGAGPGFTLLEILVVVFLIGVMTAALVARVGGGSTLDLRNAAKAVAGELRYTGERAITTGRLHRFVVDFDAQAFRVEQLSDDEESSDPSLPTHAGLLDLSPRRPASEFLAIDDDIRGDWQRLDQRTVYFDGLVRGDQTVDEGLAAVTFGADGAAQPARLRLLDENGSRIDLRVVGFTGEVRLDEDPDS